MQKGGSNKHVMVASLCLLHDFFGILQDFQCMRYPSEIIPEVIDQQLCYSPLTIIHSFISLLCDRPFLEYGPLAADEDLFERDSLIGQRHGLSYEHGEL